MRMTTLISHVIPDAQSFQVILDSFPLQQYVCSHPQSDNNPPHVKSAFILFSDDMRNYCWFVSQEMRFTDGSKIPHRWTHSQVINQYIASRTEPVVSNIHLVFLSKISTQQENKQRNICVFFSCMIMI